MMVLVLLIQRLQIIRVERLLWCDRVVMLRVR